LKLFQVYCSAFSYYVARDRLKKIENLTNSFLPDIISSVL